MAHTRVAVQAEYPSYPSGFMIVIHLNGRLDPADGTESPLPSDQRIDIVHPHAIFGSEVIMAAASSLTNTLSATTIVAFFAVGPISGSR
jgi:hypothetical protein